MQKYAQNPVGYNQDSSLNRRDFLKLVGGTTAGVAVSLSPLSVLASNNFQDDLSKVVERIIDNGTIIQKRDPNGGTYGDFYQIHKLELPDNDKTITFTLNRIEDFKEAIKSKNPLAYATWFGEAYDKLFVDKLRVEFKFDNGTYLGFDDEKIDGTIEKGMLKVDEKEPYYLTKNPKLRPKFDDAYKTAVRKVLKKFPSGRKGKIDDVFNKIN